MPSFPAPEPLVFDDEEKKEILAHLTELYDGQVEDRTGFQRDHEQYDDMFRGDVGDRVGPWPNSSNLHIPMPYWLVDALNARFHLYASGLNYMGTDTSRRWPR